MAPGRRVGAGAALACSLARTGRRRCPCRSATVRPSGTRPPRPRRPPRTTPTTTLPSAVPTTVPTPVVRRGGWAHPATTLPPAGGYTGVSCISGVFCVAVGGGANEADAADSSGPGRGRLPGTAPPGARRSDYFAHPSGGRRPPPSSPAISCTSGPLCAVVDGSGHTSLGDGTTWSTPAALAAAPGGARRPRATRARPRRLPLGRGVAARSGQFCAYVDNTGHVAVLHGARPGRRRRPSPPGSGSSTVELFQSGRVGVSCAGASACTALVGDTVLDWDGTTWTASAAPWPAGDHGGLRRVVPRGGDVRGRARRRTCPSGSPGSGWSTPRPIDPDGHLDAVSCPTPRSAWPPTPTATWCSSAGGTWSAPAKVVPTPGRVRGRRDQPGVPERPVLHGADRRRRLRHLPGGRPDAAVTTTVAARRRLTGARPRPGRSAADARPGRPGPAPSASCGSWPPGRDAARGTRSDSVASVVAGRGCGGTRRRPTTARRSGANPAASATRASHPVRVGRRRRGTVTWRRFGSSSRSSERVAGHRRRPLVARCGPPPARSGPSSAASAARQPPRPAASGAAGGPADHVAALEVGA